MSTTTTLPQLRLVDPHVIAFSFHVREDNEFWWRGKLWHATSDADLRQTSTKLEDGRRMLLMTARVTAYVVGGPDELERLEIPVDEPLYFLEDRRGN